MFGIAIQNIQPDCEKEIKFSCEKDNRLFIDDENKSANIDAGNHYLIIKRHHDFFFDWMVDGEIVDEFLVYQLVFDEDSSIIIQSKEEIKVFDKEESKNITIEPGTFFPFTMELLDLCQFSVICQKPSQLSIFFQKTEDVNERGDSYKTITLVFNKDGYCKVYIDEYKDKEFLEGYRKNISLFNTKIGINNIIQFNKEKHIMKIYNSEIKMKKYDIEGIFEDSKYLCVEETYTPGGLGKYFIEKIDG